MTPGHETCHHKVYYLSCEQYEWLLARSGGNCEICACAAAELPQRKLVIDHEHRIGRWAVRGLLCPPCNQVMGSVDEGYRVIKYEQRIAAYLALSDFEIPQPVAQDPFWRPYEPKRRERRRVGSAWMPAAYTP